MKKQSVVRALLFALVLTLAAPAPAQIIGGTVRGKVTDEQSKPIVDATVQFVNAENGRKYNLKTDKKGEYIQVGMALGTYDATLLVNGKEAFALKGIRPDASNDTVVNIDLAKERAAAQAGAQSAPEEQAKAAQIEQENAKIRNLNQMLQQAEAAKQAGNLDQAIATLQQAATVGATKELIWIRLAGYQTAAQKWADAVPSYEKAITLLKAKPPADQDKQMLAALQNNLGQAYGKTGNAKKAIEEYTAAAQINPAGAARYYFNLGAVLTNTGKVDDANAAFDKAIAIDPNYAEAHYQKGVNLLGKASLGKDGKMVAVPGTEESLNKYLELEPQGKYAQDAKSLLASIGAEVKSSYKATGKKK